MCTFPGDVYEYLAYLKHIQELGGFKFNVCHQLEFIRLLKETTWPQNAHSLIKLANWVLE